MSATQQRTYTIVHGYLRRNDPEPAESRQFKDSSLAHAYANTVRGTIYDRAIVTTTTKVR